MKVGKLIERLEFLRSIHGDISVVDREGFDLEGVRPVDECMRWRAKSSEPIAFMQIQ